MVRTSLLLRPLLVAALGLLMAVSAGAVDIAMSVDSVSNGTLCSGVTSGIGACDIRSLVDDEVTVTFALESEQSLNGYDLRVTWDDEELVLLSCQQLYPDTQAPGSIGFLIDPCTAAAPGGSDAVVLSLVGFDTTALLSLTFQVQDFARCDSDGLADVSWTPNGGGLSPGNVVLTNPAGAAVDLGIPLRECNDGLDNEGDGKIDFDGGICAGLSPAQQKPADPQCDGALDSRERPNCGLGFEAALALMPVYFWRRRRKAGN